jgi:ornithine carbamoyltransferase
MNYPKDLLSIADLNLIQILEIVHLAQDCKKRRATYPKQLEGKTVALLTTKPSLRTRLSFEIGLMELGANSLFVRDDEVGLGKRESYADVARVLSRYLSALVVRSHDHAGLSELAKYASIPVINALTQEEHPCQILADLLTIYERFGTFENIKLSYIGDGNNVCTSLMLASAIVGMHFTVIMPIGAEPPKKLVDRATALAKQYENQAPKITNDISEAALADVLYTDVWVSMGDEGAKEKTKKVFAPYQINAGIMGGKNIPVLHCLPAHKDEEIDQKAFEDNSELIFNQAENRLHAQKALLLKLLVKTN